MIWANHGANNRKRTTHDDHDGRQHRRQKCCHLPRRPRSPMQSWHDYLWMGDYDATSTSTTTPKNDLQKLLSSHYDDTQVSGHISRTPTIALEALPRLPLVGGLMKNINTYNSTKGHPTEARQSSSGMTFQFKPNDVQASGTSSAATGTSTSVTPTPQRVKPPSTTHTSW